MAFDISLSAGMRADLTSLQGTAQLLNRTQQRLSSGKSVNSAVDNPAAYFAAQDHVNHASDLAARKSDMGEAIQAVTAANNGITSITTLINQAQGLVTLAQSANTATRATMAQQFNTLRTQINQLASDSGYNGKNFLQGDWLDVLFNETGSSKLTVTGFQANAAGLGITQAACSTGTPYAGALGANLTNQTVALANSGTVSTALVVVTQTVTALPGENMVASNGSAAAMQNQTVTLAHAGSAGSVSVYEIVTAYSASVLATGAVTAGGVSPTSIANSYQLTDTMSAKPAFFLVTAGNTTLSSGYDYTATFTSNQVTIKILTAQTDTISVDYTFTKTLTQGADYTMTTGGLATAAAITFQQNFATASGIDVNYSFKAAVAAYRYSVNAGSAAGAGSIAVANGTTLTGTVGVNYTVNHTAWGDNAALNTDYNHLNAAITSLRTQASTMAANLSVITTRQTWSQSMINNLQAGSDNLTLADMNEEGANMLALQTRQQLGIQALSLASQSNQSIMRLFG